MSVRLGRSRRIGLFGWIGLSGWLGLSGYLLFFFEIRSYGVHSFVFLSILGFRGHFLMTLRSGGLNFGGLGSLF